MNSPEVRVNEISGEREGDLVDALIAGEIGYLGDDLETDLDKLDLDGRLVKAEIEEVKKMVNYTLDKKDILFHLQDRFMEFINTEYRHANETFLKTKGKAIKDLQIMLNKQLGLGIQEDGIYSKQTFLTVIEYQKQNNLTVDGLIGDQTYKALFA